MDSDNRYTYTPLEQPDKTIRLLKILSISPQISCQLSVVSLADSPVFSALSYVWGDPVITDLITVDGGTIPVTVNLASALRGVYGHWTRGQHTAPGEEQWLWADALCINQKDIPEKNFQVPLMEKIYRNAHQVLAWLGSDVDEAACRAMDTCNLVWSKISQLPGFNVMQEQTKDGQIPIDFPYDNITDGHLLEVTDLKWLEDLYQTPGRAKTFKEVRDLAYLKYWNRLWIMQEIVLARTAMLLCGSRSIPWISVCDLYFWHQLIRARYSFIDLPEYIPEMEKFLLLSYTIKHPIVEIAVCKIINSACEAAQSQGLSEVQKSWGSWLVEPLWHMNHFAMSRLATNPKDYIYAISGMSGIRMPVDYSSHTTVAKVFQDYVAQWLAVEHVPAKPSGPKNICNLYFLRDAGVGFLYDGLPGLLSWTPNFNAVAKARHGDDGLQLKWYDMGNVDLDVFPHGNEAIIDFPWIEDSVLYCTAVLIDVIANVGPIICSEDVSIHSEEDFEWLLWLGGIIATAVDEEKGAQMILDVARLHFRNKIKTKGIDLDLASALLSADLVYACNKGVSGPHDTAVDHRLAEEAASSESLALYDSDLFNMRLAAVNEKHDGPGSYELFVAAMLDYQTRRTQLDRLLIALTKSGLVGLYPPLAQNGDFIAVLNGCDSPVVLRSHGDGFQLVGVCRIDSLDNEAVGSVVRDGRAKIEKIKLF